MRSSFGKVFMGAAGTSTGASDDEFNRVSFLSHFEGSNNGVNNAFDDGSSNDHTISNAGNPTQGSFGPFARPDGEWGWNFDGNGDSLTFTNDATMSLDGDYTFELFFNARTIVLDSQHPNTILIGSTQLYIHSSDRYISWYANGGNIVHSANDSILTNVWNHVAVVRSGTGSNNTSLYLNGTRVQQAQNTATLGASSGTARIGSYTASGGNFDGHISNLRLLKGTALYSGSSITVPTSALTAITNTKLLTCQSNRFIDNSSTGFALTPVGNAAVTAFSPILTSSVYDAAVNGASSQLGATNYVSIADGAWKTLGTGDFTWEYWIYPIVENNYQLGDGTAGQNATSTFTLGFSNKRALLYYSIQGEEAYVLQSPNSAPFYNLNEWHHLAYVRAGNVHKIYANGILAASVTRSGTMVDSTGALNIGNFGPGYVSGTDGIYSDVRLVKGTAVYSGSTYTVPTAPLTAISNTELLLNFKNGQAIDSTAQNNLTLIDDANVSTDQAKFGNTSFHLDGTDDLSAGFQQVPDTSVGHFGAGNFTAECWVYPTASPNQPIIMGQWNGSYSWAIQMSNDSSRNLRFLTSATGDTVSSTAVALNQWSHVALVRNGSAFAIYLNGTSVATASSSAALLASTDAFTIGNNAGGGQPFQGYIDEVRISKMARYTSNFTAPAEPFADKGK